MSLLLRPFTFALHHYNKVALARPLLTTSLTTGFTMGVGSYACQVIMNRYETEKKSIDFRQIFNYALFGTLFTGPGLRYWWYYLDLKVFKNKAAFLRPVKMMLLDIATFRFIIIGAFIFYASLCQYKPVGQCVTDFQEKIVPVFTESLKVWPVATLVNFYLIPLQLRVLFANGVALLWNTYMAYLVSDTQTKEDIVNHSLMD